MSWVRAGSTARRRRAPFRNRSTHSCASRTTVARSSRSTARRTSSTRLAASSMFVDVEASHACAGHISTTSPNRKSGFQVPVPAAVVQEHPPASELAHAGAHGVEHRLEEPPAVEEEDAVDDVEVERAVVAGLCRRLRHEVPLDGGHTIPGARLRPRREKRAAAFDEAVRKSRGDHQDVNVHRAVAWPRAPSRRARAS